MSQDDPKNVERQVRPGRTSSRLWFGFLGGAGAWFLHHALGYGLVEINCHSQRLAFEILGLDASVFLALVLTAVAAATATWAMFTSLSFRSGRFELHEVETAGNVEMRGRVGFLSIVGALLSALFLVAILTGASAFLFLLPC